MNTFALVILLLVITFALIFFRMPIAFSFGLMGFIGIMILGGPEAALQAIGTIPFATTRQYVWSVLPLFVLMGYMASETKLAMEFYEGVRKWIGHWRGGLASAVIIGNTAFGAVCGDLIAAACTFTSMSLPEMRKYKYDDRLTLGAIGAGGFLSILIPPSLGFILYGGITQTSIGQLFIAGIIPGLILSALYLTVIYIWCKKDPAAGPPGPKATWGEKWRAAPGMWALVFIFVVIIGGLYMGLFTPTEAGGVGAFIVFIMGLARKKFTWERFKKALLDTGLTTGMVLFLIVGVLIFNLFLVMSKLPYQLEAWVVSLTSSPIILILIITLIYFILGTFMDAMAVMLLTVPLFFPVLTHMGITPITFGVIAVMSMCIGGFTPPYGIVVYAMGGIVRDISIFRIFRGVLPFLIPMIIVELLVIFIPALANWLPSTMSQ